MDMYIAFEASEVCRENHPHGPDRVEVGPFVDYVQLTYYKLTVGDTGEAIAYYREGDGCWEVVDNQYYPEVNELDGLFFSDVVIYAK